MTEDQRLEVLHSLKVLDSPPDKRFQRIVEDAKEAFDVPMVMVSLIDRDRQWFKACLGMDATETPRSVSFCSICIEKEEILIIEDASVHPLVRDNPLVTGEPHIRFYAGCPLRVRGALLGTLCIIGMEPRNLSASEVKLLEVFGHWAQSELDQAELGALAREAELSQRRYQAIFHASASAVAVFSVEGEYIEGNALAESLWDVANSGPPVLRTSSFGGESLVSGFHQATLGHSCFVEPFAYRRPNGQRAYLQISLDPLQYLGHCSGVVMTIDDVTTTVLTSQNQATKDFDNLRDRAASEQASGRRQAYVAVLAHEMRNPLNGILGMAEVLKTRCSATDAELVASIHECAETLSYLIDDTLDLELIQQGRLALDASVFDLGALVASVLSLVQPQAVQKSVTVHNAPAGPLDFVKGDEQRVRQVLSNYVTNAVKYSRDGGEVKVRCGPANGGYLFEVFDNGVGISADAISTVFDPFFQVKRNAANSQRGLGLGLNIVKNIVELMGGTLGVESVLGEGSRFWAQLPLESAPPPRALEKAAERIVARILVVDDNPINRRILTLQLSSMGATVEEAENGQIALDLLGERAFDVVLLDCQMPVLNGFETARAIRSQPDRYGRSPIVALTAATSDESQQECFEAGMDDFLSKPIRAIDLNTKLHELLNA